MALLLDGKVRTITRAQISEGSLNQSIVHPREVFNVAVRESAAAMILLHNHPTGDPTPSPEDLEVTLVVSRGGATDGSGAGTTSSSARISFTASPRKVTCEVCHEGYGRPVQEAILLTRHLAAARASTPFRWSPAEERPVAGKNGWSGAGSDRCRLGICRRQRDPRRWYCSAVGSAAGLAGVDIVYASKGVISKIDPSDAAAEVALIIYWALAIY